MRTRKKQIEQSEIAIYKKLTDLLHYRLLFLFLFGQFFSFQQNAHTLLGLKRKRKKHENVKINKGHES